MKEMELTFTWAPMPTITVSYDGASITFTAREVESAINDYEFDGIVERVQGVNPEFNDAQKEPFFYWCHDWITEWVNRSHMPSYYATYVEEKTTMRAVEEDPTMRTYPRSHIKEQHD